MMNGYMESVEQSGFSQPHSQACSLSTASAFDIMTGRQR
jgi:hypothetical protein